MVHWSLDGWRNVHESHTTDTQLGIDFADLPTDQLPPGRRLSFTFFWLDAQRWEGTDFDMRVVAGR